MGWEDHIGIPGFIVEVMRAGSDRIATFSLPLKDKGVQVGVRD